MEKMSDKNQRPGVISTVLELSLSRDRCHTPLSPYLTDTSDFEELYEIPMAERQFFNQVLSAAKLEEGSEEVLKMAGEVQIWFLNDQKERIWNELKTERIWDPEQLKTLGVNPKKLPYSDEDRYATVTYDKWNPHDEKKKLENIPLFLQLKDQAVPPEARYIAAFTAFLDDAVTYKTGGLTPSLPTAVIDLKDTDKAWKEDKSLKVRIEQKWQNFDAVYSFSKPLDLVGDSSDDVFYTNVDRVISFLPPEAGESEITHYNIYKGQWLPCNDNKDISVKQREREYKTLAKTVNDGRGAARVCWGFCLPREYNEWSDSSDSESHSSDSGLVSNNLKSNYFHDRKCSRRSEQKEKIPGTNKRKHIKYKEGAFIKSVPAMNYMLPYCISKKSFSDSDTNDSDFADSSDDADSDMSSSRDSCESIKLETKTVSDADLSVFIQGKVAGESQVLDKHSDLWKRYGPAIHTTTKIQSEIDLKAQLEALLNLKEEELQKDGEESGIFTEHVVVTVTGPGILTVDQLGLPGANSQRLSKTSNVDDTVQASLSYKDFKFGGSFAGSGAIAQGRRFPDIRVPAGKHQIEWRVTVNARAFRSVEADAQEALREALKLKWTLSFHSTARYENIHVHVPDINLKPTSSDDDHPADSEESGNFIPSSIVIVPAFRKKLSSNNSGSLNDHDTRLRDFVEVDSELANGIDIDLPPSPPPMPKLKPSEAQPDSDSESIGTSESESDSTTGTSKTPKLVKTFQNDGIKFGKPDSVHFLDTNPDENAFSGTVKIVASSSHSSSIASSFAAMPNNGKDKKVRLSAALHWYEDPHAEENLMSKLWMKTASKSEGETDWIPNSLTKKHWSGWHYEYKTPGGKEEVSQSSESHTETDTMMNPHKSSGVLWQGSCDAIIPFLEGSEDLESGAGTPDTERRTEEISCTIDMDSVSFDVEKFGKFKKPKKFRMIANEIDFAQSLTYNSQSGSPDMMSDMTLSDMINLPSVSSLIVPVYDVTVPTFESMTSQSFFSPGAFSLSRGWPAEWKDTWRVTVGRPYIEFTNLWDAMTVNIANLGGPHTVGLTGFRWYWENKDFIDSEKLSGAGDEKLNGGLGEQESVSTNVVSAHNIKTLDNDERFFGEATLNLICPPVFSNEDVVRIHSGDESNSRMQDFQARFATSPGYPGCEILGPFGPRCYSSEFYSSSPGISSEFDSCTNGGWEIIHVVQNSGDENGETESKKKLVYRLKKTIKYENESEWIYFPTAGRMVLKEFEVNREKWNSVHFGAGDSGSENTSEKSEKGTSQGVQYHENLFQQFQQDEKFKHKISKPGTAFLFQSGLWGHGAYSSEDSEVQEKDSDSENDYFVIDWMPELDDYEETLGPPEPLESFPNSELAEKIKKQREKKSDNKNIKLKREEFLDLNTRKPLSMSLIADALVNPQYSNNEDYTERWQIENEYLSIKYGEPKTRSMRERTLSAFDGGSHHSRFTTMLDIAATLRVVPVYHNYLHVRQSEAFRHRSEVSSRGGIPDRVENPRRSVRWENPDFHDASNSLTAALGNAAYHSVDVNGPRYDVAAFRVGPGVSVSMNFEKVAESKCTTETVSVTDEKTGLTKKKKVFKDMTCTITREFDYDYRQKHLSFRRAASGNWKLKIWHEFDIASRSQGEFPEGFARTEKIYDMTYENLPQYCIRSESTYYPERDPKRHGMSTHYDFHWTFPVGECGSTVQTVFDYKSGKMKQRASVLMVYGNEIYHSTSEEIKAAVPVAPPHECSCEMDLDEVYHDEVHDERDQKSPVDDSDEEDQSGPEGIGEQKKDEDEKTGKKTSNLSQAELENRWDLKEAAIKKKLAESQKIQGECTREEFDFTTEKTAVSETAPWRIEPLSEDVTSKWMIKCPIPAKDTPTKDTGSEMTKDTGGMTKDTGEVNGEVVAHQWTTKLDADLVFDASVRSERFWSVTFSNQRGIWYRNSESIPAYCKGEGITRQWEISESDTEGGITKMQQFLKLPVDECGVAGTRYTNYDLTASVTLVDRKKVINWSPGEDIGPVYECVCEYERDNGKVDGSEGEPAKDQVEGSEGTGSEGTGSEGDEDKTEDDSEAEKTTPEDDKTTPEDDKTTSEDDKTIPEDDKTTPEDTEEKTIPEEDDINKIPEESSQERQERLMHNWDLKEQAFRDSFNFPQAFRDDSDTKNARIYDKIRGECFQQKNERGETQLLMRCAIQNTALTRDYQERTGSSRIPKWTLKREADFLFNEEQAEIFYDEKAGWHYLADYCKRDIALEEKWITEDYIYPEDHPDSGERTTVRNRLSVMTFPVDECGGGEAETMRIMIIGSGHNSKTIKKAHVSFIDRNKVESWPHDIGPIYDCSCEHNFDRGSDQEGDSVDLWRRKESAFENYGKSALNRVSLPLQGECKREDFTSENGETTSQMTMKCPLPHAQMLGGSSATSIGEWTPEWMLKVEADFIFDPLRAENLYRHFYKNRSLGKDKDSKDSEGTIFQRRHYTADNLPSYCKAESGVVEQEESDDEYDTNSKFLKFPVNECGADSREFSVIKDEWTYRQIKKKRVTVDIVDRKNIVNWPGYVAPIYTCACEYDDQDSESDSSGQDDTKSEDDEEQREVFPENSLRDGLVGDNAHEQHQKWRHKEQLFEDSRKNNEIIKNKIEGRCYRQDVDSYSLISRGELKTGSDISAQSIQLGRVLKSQLIMECSVPRDFQDSYIQEYEKTPEWVLKKEADFYFNANSATKHYKEREDRYIDTSRRPIRYTDKYCWDFKEVSWSSSDVSGSGISGSVEKREALKFPVPLGETKASWSDEPLFYDCGVVVSDPLLEVDESTGVTVTGVWKRTASVEFVDSSSVRDWYTTADVNPIYECSCEFEVDEGNRRLGEFDEGNRRLLRSDFDEGNRRLTEEDQNSGSFGLIKESGFDQRSLSDGLSLADPLSISEKVLQVENLAAKKRWSRGMHSAGQQVSSNSTHSDVAHVMESAGMGDVLKIDLTVSKSSKWAVKYRNLLEMALKSALLSGCNHVKEADSSSDVKDVIEKVTIASIVPVSAPIIDKLVDDAQEMSKMGTKIEFSIVLGAKAARSDLKSDLKSNNPLGLRFQLESRVQLLAENAPRIVGKFVHSFHHEAGANFSKKHRLEINDVRFS